MSKKKSDQNQPEGGNLPKPEKRELRKVPFNDPLPDITNFDKALVSIEKDFLKFKSGEEKEVSGFIAKQLVHKGVAKFIKLID